MLTGDIRPLGSRIFVHRDPKPEKSAGGILMPDTAKAPTLVTGIVAAVGPGYPLESGAFVEPRVRVGDRVAFESDASFVEVSEGRILIAEHALLCVVEPLS